MTIHKEGSRTIAYSIITFLLIGLIIYFSAPDLKLLHYIYIAISALIIIWIISFFRYPNRKTAINSNHIISSADGTVVAIEEVMENEYFKSKVTQVSIFMSPMNIHANWYPVSGIIKQTKYQPGKHLVAFNPKSSLENEMAVTVIETPDNKAILVRQIAGAMARRVVCYAKTNAQVEQGEQLGFIKFGSRVDLLFPPDAKVKVQLNQKVKGKQTIIASFE